MPRLPIYADVLTRAAIAVFAVSLALYALTACRTVYFGDSGELIAASHALGVAHPPGYPLYTILGKLALLLPLGEPAFRMNLLSALFGALTCGGVTWVGGRLTRSAAAGVGGGIALAVSSVWTVATVAEVYTLHLGLVVAVLICATVLRDAGNRGSAERAVLSLGLLLGAGLAHRPTILLTLPAAMWIALPGLLPRKNGERRPAIRPGVIAVAVALATLVPALLYGSLVLRSRAGAVANWGRPNDVSSLLAHVGTQAYGFYAVGPAGWLRPEAWARLGRMLLESLGTLGILCAVVGVLAGLRGGRLRALSGPLVLLALPALLFGLSYATEDVEVLFLPLLPATTLAIVVGLAEVNRRLGRGALPALLIAVALGGSGLMRGLPRNDLSTVTAARDYAQDMLASVPQSGSLFVEGDDAFVLAYLTQVLGARSDLRLYDRNGVMFRDETAEAGSPPHPRESPLAFRVRREQEFVQRNRETPIYFMTWPGYGLPDGLSFEPRGLLYRVRRPADPVSDPAGLWAKYHESSVKAHALQVDTGFVRAVAATYPLMRGERRLYEGDLNRALEAFDAASRIGGESESTHNYLGAIFGRLGDYPRAIREFETAIRIQPVSIRAWNNLALARAYSGDTEGARRAFRRSLEIAPAQADAEAQLRRLTQ